MHRYGLHDDEWERIEHLLPGREGHVGATAKNNRLFVEAILYRYRAGIGDVPPFVEHCERSLPWLTLRGVGLANKDAVA
jgi:hypothetical protein